MARGHSGRIVIEVEPEMKKELYAALDVAGSTLKEWFLKTAQNFCTETNQPSLFGPTLLTSAVKPVGSQNLREKIAHSSKTHAGKVRRKAANSR